MNPITIHSRKALAGIGALIRSWTLDAASRPDGIEEYGRLWVIERAVFEKALAARGLSAGVDYQLRDGIEAVELVVRRDDRATLVLPEAAVLREVAAGDTTVALPRLYRDTDRWPVGDPPHPQALAEDELAMYAVTLGSDPFADFLDAHMAAYSVTQCK